ncbi:rRNA maturation RNase YbeY [candidate division WWE3 bacterium RIFCSPHIGHO2_01_FULL_42_13]|uniref:Endoribonuclease YbeY n=1 Tax=candidate division WWE3 bacterium RIFCSPHIGHO2_01_FULL_42_13 TaxID=1802617 RepID=A0A1F4URL3_UNCKA|nr:MAG: rRNA maturation RNase YbeY [candidate division WWE3 bacterium RIFCSPHIGHO2_01_FULL_42_13]
MKLASNTHVSISIVGDDEMRKLNKEHLGRDYATDVLSFNVEEQTEQGFYLGDIVVNKDQAERQAMEFDNSLEEEIAELVAHGMLHLMGMHHEGDEH